MLKRQASLDTIEETIRDPSCVATTFFNKVLNKASSSLSITTRTRQHNLSLTSRHYTPEYYRLYPEDISALSMEIKYAIKSLPPDEQFTFYNNLGQQQPLTSPRSIRSLNLDMVISDVNKIEYSSCHIAVNFRHTETDYSILWDPTKTAIFLRGQKVVKYPFMGLAEVGNVTSTFPRTALIKNAWRRDSREDIHVTYAQAYTPFNKPMGTRRPFIDHPYLLSFLLGREYV